MGSFGTLSGSLSSALGDLTVQFLNTWLACPGFLVIFRGAEPCIMMLIMLNTMLTMLITMLSVLILLIIKLIEDAYGESPPPLGIHNFVVRPADIKQDFVGFCRNLLFFGTFQQDLSIVVQNLA